MASTAAPTRSFIDPHRLYTLRGFQIESGVSATRMREGRLQGLHPNLLIVGKRKFLRGVDAIQYIEKLAALPKSSE